MLEILLTWCQHEHNMSYHDRTFVIDVGFHDIQFTLELPCIVATHVSAWQSLFISDI